jgi:hypothetical protein
MVSSRCFGFHQARESGRDKEDPSRNAEKRVQSLLSSEGGIPQYATGTVRPLSTPTRFCTKLAFAFVHRHGANLDRHLPLASWVSGEG